MTDGRQWVLGRVDYQRVALRHGVLPTTVKMSTGVDARVGRNRYLRAHTHTHTRLTALFPGQPRCTGTRKVKPICFILKQETVSGSGISWAICKSAPRSRQTTTQAPHHSVFTGRMPFLPPNRQCQSTEGKCSLPVSNVDKNSLGCGRQNMYRSSAPVKIFLRCRGFLKFFSCI